jgi:outer membrane protein OmpA-like peptidoglycan-associated protein
MKTLTQSLAIASCLVLLAACTTTGGYSQSNPPPPEDEEGLSRTQKGAMIGAAAGIVAGLLSGGDATERRQRALVGAGVGGLAGGAIGNYQDKQERALRAQMQGSGVDVVRQGDNITLDLPSGITFGFDSAALKPEFYPVLDRVADTLRQYDQTIIEVAGHTDSQGSEAYNQRLSEQRAQAVGDFLVQRGVSRERLILTGAGETRPVASNETEAGRAENRRVEITLVPIRA